MKHNICFMLVQLIFAISSVSPAELKPFLISPMGPYKLVVKQIYNCNPTKNNIIQHNMYATNKNNHTILFGNSTLEEPFDDSFFGLYISPGFDPVLFEKSNFPKTFFYGTYKCHIYYTRKNEIFGCQALIIELKRP